MAKYGHIPVAALTALLLLPGLAQASEVHVAAPPDRAPCCGYPGTYHSTDSVFYVADPGEHNNVVLTSGVGTNQFNDVTVHDSGAVIRAGDHCVSIDQHTARCQGDTSLAETEAYLGDQADELHINEAGALVPSVFAAGGSGDDVLVGGPHADWLDGGGGQDLLAGRAGTDILDDGDVTGASGAAGPRPDMLEGGPDRDLVTYGHRTAPVTVELTSLIGGEFDERDWLHNIEDVVGGKAADSLTGTSADNQLRGGNGADELIGLEGKDDINGGAGPDEIDAGNDNDRLVPGAGTDSFFCGLGYDVVVHPAAGEVIGPCEEVFFDKLGRFVPGEGPGNVAFPPHPATSKTTLKFVISCPAFDIDGGSRNEPCAGTLKVREASGRRRLLGKIVRLRDRKRDAAVVRVRLNSLGRKLIRRRGGVLATVVLRGARSSGHPLPNVAWTIRLGL
jgi:hypothetical protein